MYLHLISDIWGFDDQAVSVLQSMKPQDLETLVNKYSILLDSSSELLPQNTKEGVSSINVETLVNKYSILLVSSSELLPQTQKKGWVELMLRP